MSEMKCKCCGNCIFFTGEECNGDGSAPEGYEMYEDSKACGSFEPVEDEQLNGNCELMILTDLPVENCDE